ncbi:TPA_asm: hypothetical protein GND48_004108 [Salmonella enterica subsp. houtenae serovar 41:z4,z23:-]|nr:hypothetical protein [Salmonella enterica]EDO2903799.1 hypothetical protein [Salmonella enterica]HAE4738884.1 hypothetical protein [Salmonella enterica subsp. houtenae serovar 41:z4,z23:-]
MTTITRERLLKIQQWSETYGAGSNVMLPAEEAEELARIALASLEVAPVGEVSEKRYGLVMDGTVDLGGKSTYRIIKGEKAMKRLPFGTKFYIAPPAPVVPLSITLPDTSSKAFWSGTGKKEVFHPETYKRWVKEAIERFCMIAGIAVEVK